MSSDSYFSINNMGIPSYRPTSISKENTSINSNSSSPVFQQFQEAFTPSPIQTSEKKSLKNTQVIHKEKEESGSEIDPQVDKMINEFVYLEDDLKNIKDKAEDVSSTEATLSIVQYWVADFVKGGSVASQSGLPFVLQTKADTLPALDPVTESIKLATDVVDIGTGFVAVIHQRNMFKAAREEISKLKRNSDTLDPAQLARLKKLEKSIKQAENRLPLQAKEQMIRVGRNLLSYTTFVLSWIRDIPGIQSISAAAYAFIGGFNAALFAFGFYRAHQDLEAHRSWSKDFKEWVKKHTLSISQPNITTSGEIELVELASTKILEKRMERRNKAVEQINLLKNKLASQELKIETVHDRIKNFKRSGLQRFIENLDLKKMDVKQFEDKLKEKLGIPLETALPQSQSIYEAALQLKEIQSKDLSSEEKQAALDEAQNSIANDLNACCEKWIESQSEDALLSAYVDYQSVLDPTVKNSLIEMVQKKLKIEKVFFKFKKFQMGTQLSVSTIIFGIALTLAIIGLATTPVGAGAVILALLAISAMAVSFGLMGRGYYLSHQEKPALTAAILKGTYFKLYSYYALAKIHSLSERITNSIQKSKYAKRLANFVDQSPVIHQFFAHQVKEDSIEMQDFAAIKANHEKDKQEVKSKSQKWKDRATALENELEELTWRDFAKKADLKVASKSPADLGKAHYLSFDTLEVLNEAINQADFDLLSPNTKELIETQIGIDIQALRVEIQKDPSTFKRLLRTFFNLDDVAFAKFVGEQRLRES